MNFQEPTVLLTAVLFHYAGFAASLLARSSRVALGHARTPRPLITAFPNVVALGVLAGPGMLAAGFVIGPRLKLLAALVLAASEIGLALCFLFAVGRLRDLPAKLLVLMGAVSVVFSMIFAALWAIGEYPLQPFVHLSEMARLHGTANAFGFTLCGLLGWARATSTMHITGGSRPR
jgi:YndJ-like protein